MPSDEHVYGFDFHDASALASQVPRGTGREITLHHQPVLRQGGYLALTPSGGIPARVGTTVTMVDCPIYYLAGTGSTRTLTSTGVSLPVGNMSTTAIAGSAYIMVAPFGGALLPPWEDC